MLIASMFKVRWERGSIWHRRRSWVLTHTLSPSPLPHAELPNERVLLGVESWRHGEVRMWVKQNRSYSLQVQLFSDLWCSCVLKLLHWTPRGIFPSIGGCQKQRCQQDNFLLSDTADSTSLYFLSYRKSPMPPRGASQGHPPLILWSKNFPKITHGMRLYSSSLNEWMNEWMNHHTRPHLEISEHEAYMNRITILYPGYSTISVAFRSSNLRKLIICTRSSMK